MTDYGLRCVHHLHEIWLVRCAGCEAMNREAELFGLSPLTEANNETKEGNR